MAKSPQSAKFGRFLVRQALGKTVDSLIEADVAIFNSGWEERGLEFTNVSALNIKRATAFRFASPEAPTQERAQFAALRAFLAERGVRAKAVSLDTVSALDKNSEKIGKIARAMPADGNSTVFIEATTLPRIYLQRLVHRLFGQANVARVIVGYAVGAYDEQPSDGNASPYSKMTEGSWRLDSVVTGKGASSAESRRHLIVVLGSETEKTVSTIRDLEPYGVVVIRPLRSSNKFLDDVGEACIREMESDATMCRIAHSDLQHWDLIGTTQKVIDTARSTDTNDTLTFFGFGPKPLALAGLIANLADEGVEVMGRVPARYLPVPRRATGEYAIYEIVDLCHPGCTFLPTSVFTGGTGLLRANT